MIFPITVRRWLEVTRWENSRSGFRNAGFMMYIPPACSVFKLNSLSRGF